tara:strand:+ start:7203 stop:8576 length:1374 start_codon:yes stop_codon:yes gene_type:complete
MLTKSTKVHFLGGAGTVTGSKFLVETEQHKILVDCGLFQGLKKLRKLNWSYLPVNAKEIDAIVLTHGHLDHVGFIPRLVKMGFKGKIYGTSPTLAIAEIILLDSAKIQEEEAERANAGGYSKHDPAEPLYTIKEAHHSLSFFREVEVNEWETLFPDIRVRFQYVGHIIGASFIELQVNDQRLVFSGDVGRKNDLLMKNPSKPELADYLFLEATYGNRNHPKEDVATLIKDIVLKTVAKGGTLIIPSFAVERTQIIMYMLWKLVLEKKIPKLPMIMDSPMGADVLKVFYEHDTWHNLSIKDFESMCQSFHITQDFQETLAVVENKEPKIIIAASGMISGGRVLTYLQHYLEKESTSILLAGFQAEGTRGRKLLEGASEMKIYGDYYHVKAAVFSINSLSAHADQNELLDWVSSLKEAPKNTFLVHAEPHAADCLRQIIEDKLKWNCHIPELFEIVELQ